MKQTYIFGDVHGELNKLKQCLSLCGIKKGDRLISLGDLVDRGPNSFEVIELCLDLQKEYECIFLKGNHDDCFLVSVECGLKSMLYEQGGRQTMFSYTRNGCENDPTKIPETHKEFFRNQQLYFIDEENNCFVHGGFNRHYFIDDEIHNDTEVLIWDRDLLSEMLSYDKMLIKDNQFKIKNNFKEIFIGHTPTIYHIEESIPLNVLNLWDLDTGCGKGKFPLTIMKLSSKKYWQSKC